MKPTDAGLHHGGRDSIPGGAGGRSEDPHQGVSSAGAIDEYGAFVAGGETQIGGGEGGFHGRAAVRRLPSRQGRRLDRLGVHGRPIRLMPLHGRYSDGTRPPKVTSSDDRASDVLAPVTHQGGDDGLRVRPLHEGHAGLKLGDPADLFAPCHVMGQAHASAVVPDEAVDHMPVHAALFLMLLDETWQGRQAEFLLVSVKEGVADLGAIPAMWGIDVQMVHRAVRPPMRRAGDEAVQRLGRRRRAEVAHIDELRPLPLRP